MPAPAVAPISSPWPPAAHPAIQPLEACWHAFRRSGLHTLLEEALAVQAHSPVSGTPSVVLTSRIAKAVSLTRLVGEPPSRPEQSTALETALAPVGATLAAWASYQAARTVVLADPPLWSTLDTAGWLDTPASQMAPPLSFLIAVVPGESGVHYLGIRHDLVAHLPALSIQRLQPEPQEIPGTDATLPNCWETLLVVPAAHTPAQVIATITDRVRQPGILRPGTTTTGRSSIHTEPADWVRWLEHHGVGLALNLLAYIHRFPESARRISSPAHPTRMDARGRAEDRPPSVYRIHPAGALRRDH